MCGSSGMASTRGASATPSRSDRRAPRPVQRQIAAGRGDASSTLPLRVTTGADASHPGTRRRIGISPGPASITVSAVLLASGNRVSWRSVKLLLRPLELRRRRTGSRRCRQRRASRCCRQLGEFLDSRAGAAPERLILGVEGLPHARRQRQVVPASCRRSAGSCRCGDSAARARSSRNTADRGTSCIEAATASACCRRSSIQQCSRSPAAPPRAVAARPASLRHCSCRR